MPLPTDYGTGIVTGTFTDTNGDPVVGTISFTPSASRLLGTGAVILGDPVVVDLDADGSISVTLPASNDPNVNPTDFTYRVDETFVGVVGSTYFIDVLEGTTLDLSDVAVPGTVNNGTVIWAGEGLANAVDVPIVADVADVAAAINGGAFTAVVVVTAETTVDIVLPDPTTTPGGWVLTWSDPTGVCARTYSGADYVELLTPVNLAPAPGEVIYSWHMAPTLGMGTAWTGSPLFGADQITAGSGDVVGPASSTDGRAVLFDGTTGKIIKAASAAPMLVGDAPTAHAASHKAGGSDPLTTRLQFSNADYTIVTTTPSTVVSQTGTLSAARVVTLPAASAVPAGAEVIVQAGIGCSGTNTLSIARAGSDTINGGSSSAVIGTAFAWRRLVSDGTSAWTLDAGILRQSDLGVTVAAYDPIARFPATGVANFYTDNIYSGLQGFNHASFGGGGTGIVLGANLLWLWMIMPVETVQVDGGEFQVSTSAASGKKARIGIYAHSPSAGATGAPLVDSGAMAADGAGGTVVAATWSAVTLTAFTPYWACIETEDASFAPRYLARGNVNNAEVEGLDVGATTGSNHVIRRVAHTFGTLPTNPAASFTTASSTRPGVLWNVRRI